MKLISWGRAALMVALCASVASATSTKEGGSSGPSSFDSDMQQAELASYNSCGSDSCGTDCCDAGGWGLAGLMNRPIQIIAGAEYLYARADFSEAQSYVENNSVTGTTTFHQYDFDYNSSYGFFGGFNLCDCGGQVLFNFRRLTSDANFSAFDSSTIDNFGPYEVDGRIDGYADADLKSYDLSFAKTIPLGCPLVCGGCGDSCCGDSCCGDECCGDGCCGGGSGGCGCGWCPAWDIQWSGGVRFASVNWNRGLTAFDQNSTVNPQPVIDSYNTSMNFDGFGGRVGLLGRRYIGRRGLFSLYAKGDWSLLVGEIDIVNTVTNQAGPAFAQTTCTHLVPVTEIELGGTVHLGCHASASAGYFWAAWHDLGMRDQYDFNQFQIQGFDDANILGWDGLFARVQVNF
jgi:hypothetical protein